MSRPHLYRAFILVVLGIALLVFLFRPAKTSENADSGVEQAEIVRPSALHEVKLDSSEAESIVLPGQDIEEKKSKPLRLVTGAEDITETGNLRRTEIKGGVEYKVNERNSMSVELKKQTFDREDAKAWNKKGEDSDEVGVKYKLSF